MQIEGYIEFENSIPVTADCLGKEFPIEIAGYNGIIATPILFKGFQEMKKVGSLNEPEIGEINFKDQFDWGTVYSWPNGDSEIRAFKLLFPNIPPELFEISGKKIALELEKWRSRLIENISFTLRKDYRGELRSKTISSFGVGKFALFKNRSGYNNIFIPDDRKTSNISIYFGSSRNLDEEGLKEIFENSSNEIEPLLPFYFFLDAERSHFDEHYRKSVLDSATATEVCFSQIIGELIPTTEDLNKYIYSKHNSLKQKRELLQVLKVHLPVKENEYFNKLDKVRNRVIHGGYIPSKHEAHNALLITENTLYTLLPFKKKTII